MKNPFESVLVKLSKTFLKEKGYSFTNYNDIPVGNSVNDSLNIFIKNNFKIYSSWVSDCIDIWGKWFTRAEFRLYDKGEVEILNHPIIDLFKSPNPFQSWWEVMFRQAQHICIYGNVYWWKRRDRMGVTREIIQLNPLSVTPVTTKDAYIGYYKYFNGKSYEKLPTEDVIQFRYPDPDNLLIGKPVIAKVFNQSEVDYLQTMYQKAFYEQGGFMGLTFTTDQAMSKENFDNALNRLRQNYGGVDGAYKVSLVDSGVKPVNASHSIKDMDISSQRQLTRDEITSAFEVQKLLLGIGEATNRATAETAAYLFVSGVVEPFLNMFDEVLTKDLAMEFDPDFYIKHDTLSQKDIETNLKYYENGIQNGWLTINEVRELEGYADIPAPAVIN